VQYTRQRRWRGRGQRVPFWQRTTHRLKLDRLSSQRRPGSLQGRHVAAPPGVQHADERMGFVQHRITGDL